MSTTAVGQCSQCGAVVNLHWPACLVCHAPSETHSSAPTEIRSDDIVLEPASPTARPVYWESREGTWHGPVKPEYLGKTGTGDKEVFWVVVCYNKTVQWIRSDLLRSRQAFEAQRKGTR